MNEDRRQILEMLANSKITADEAERLIAALDAPKSGPYNGKAADQPKFKPRYMRVLVEEGKEDAMTTKVNVRIPMQLLRAGVKLAALIPDQARAQVNMHLRENGIAIDLNQIKPENLEELVDQLAELTVDVDDKGSKVRVFCE